MDICTVCQYRHILCGRCFDKSLFAYDYGSDKGLDTIFDEGLGIGEIRRYEKIEEYKHKFTCPICHNPFIREIGMIQHLKDKHGICVKDGWAMKIVKIYGKK